MNAGRETAQRPPGSGPADRSAVTTRGIMNGAGWILASRYTHGPGRVGGRGRARVDVGHRAVAFAAKGAAPSGTARAAFDRRAPGAVA